ncbi:hypothetical protein OAC89_05790 [Deltaproteobacteria bacterium]|nr:hypothetical protein [Deltaproteobacteria bacterium]
MEKKDCFGILDKIFPLGDKGLREIVPECFDCSDRILCLKEALKTKEGVDMRVGILDRIPASGLVGKIRRWSQKKDLNRLVEEEKKEKR